MNTQGIGLFQSSLMIYYKPVVVAQQGLATVTIPAFMLSGFDWLGASYIALEFDVTFSENWAISDLFVPNQFAMNNFVLAVRWPSADAPYNPNRRLIWSSDLMVLHYPLYAGETLPAAGVVFEVWTINNGSTTILNAAPMILRTSKLLDIINAYYPPAEDNGVTTNANIWEPLPCPIPSVFNNPRV